MEYIVIEDGKVARHGAVASAEKMPDGAVPVKGRFSGVVGDSVQFYDGNWNRLPDEELYEKGLLPIPAGFRWDRTKGMPVEMTREEKIAAGLEQAPAGMKLVNGCLAAMSAEERVAAGQATVDDIAAETRALRDEMLAETDRFMLPDFPLENGERELVKEYRESLRHLPERDGFPFVDVPGLDMKKIKEIAHEGH